MSSEGRRGVCEGDSGEGVRSVMVEAVVRDVLREKVGEALREAQSCRTLREKEEET